MKNLLARRDLLRLGLAASTLVIAPTLTTAHAKNGKNNDTPSEGALLDYSNVQVLFVDLQT